MTILDRIVASKKSEVEARRRDLTAELRAAPPTRGFAAAIRSALLRPALIAEVKKASPSEGVIREGFDPAEIARVYEAAGAVCLSVLTDEEFFQGSTQNLVLSRAAVGLPVLRKDFMVDLWQIEESRAMGADAVLLIAAILSTDELRSFRELAESVGMDALVEVHDQVELESALASGARMVGVNNRNLATFLTDLATTEHLFPRIPSDLIRVSESGIGTHADVKRVVGAGADAVLVGTRFCREPDIASAVREVMGR